MKCNNLFLFLFGIILFCFLTTNLSVFGQTIATQPIEPMADVNVTFLLAGPPIFDQNCCFRVSLRTGEIFSIIIVDKIEYPKVEGDSKILWSRLLNLNSIKIFIAPANFEKHFIWLSPTSFSFISIDNTKYIVVEIDKNNPKIIKTK